MNNNFITIHQSADNTTLILNASAIIMATARQCGDTALVTIDTNATSTRHTFFINESIARIKSMLATAGIDTVLVHGNINNDEILITTDNIFSIAESKNTAKKGVTPFVGSIINMKQYFVRSIECNETYTKITSQL